MSVGEKDVTVALPREKCAISVDVTQYPYIGRRSCHGSITSNWRD